MLLTAAGAVDPDRFIGEASSSFETLETGGVQLGRLRPSATPGVYVLTRPVEQVHFCIGFDGLPTAHEDRYALFLLNTVLGGGMSSRLFQKIREEYGLAYSVYSYHSAYHDAGLATIYCGTSPDGYAKAMEIIREEMERLCCQEIPSEELDTARRQLKGNLLLGLESTSNRMNQLARNEIYFGRQVPIPEITEGIESVTAGAVRELAGALFDRSRMALTVIGPLEEEAVRDAAAR